MRLGASRRWRSLGLGAHQQSGARSAPRVRVGFGQSLAPLALAPRGGSRAVSSGFGPCHVRFVLYTEVVSLDVPGNGRKRTRRATLNFVGRELPVWTSPVIQLG
jgi:hypothetical protein